MELAQVIGWCVTIVVAVFGSYQAAKRAADERERKTLEELAEIRIEIKHLIREVEKHNSVMERTFKLETEVDNLYHRYDEIRSDVKEVKIGGTE
ncbi:MAG: hypothetical protein IIZ69_04385 [Pseudomonas sp.]|nr:hypothetical protein [Pseudomonas sp.]